MEELHLETTFTSIYLAGPTFNLLPDDTAALSALKAIASHLQFKGAAFIHLRTPVILLTVPKQRIVGTVGRPASACCLAPASPIVRVESEQARLPSREASLRSGMRAPQLSSEALGGDMSTR